MKQYSVFFGIFFFLSFAAFRANGATIRVPSMAATIQAAVTAAASGDTILLASGTYTGSGNRDISFSGKQLVILSESGSSATIIDVQNQPVAAFELDANEATGVVFSGITIRHARNGLYLNDAYPELRDMKFVDNQIGVNCIRYEPADSLVRPTFTNVSFSSNDTGVYILSGSTQPGTVAILSHCTFSNNSRGLVYYSNEPQTDRHVSIVGCTFRNNSTGITSYDFVFHEELVVDSALFDGNGTAIVNSVSLSNSTITGGQYGIKGFLSSRVEITNCRFEDISNTVLRANVWGPSSQASPPPNFDPGFLVTDCIFTGNEGGIASLGGFINEDPVGASFYNCQFTHNGGGIFGVEGVHMVVMENCLYANNGDGIEMRASGTGLTITGCTFANNVGAAVDSWLDDWNVTVSNSIFYGHSGAGIRFSHFDQNSHWSLSCNDFFDNDGGDCVGIPPQVGMNGNFSANPLFCNSESGEYSVYQQSPCVPQNSFCGEQVGALGAACQLSGVDSLVVDTATNNLHVISSQPLIIWSRMDISQSQTAAEVQVGSDSDWSTAELWSPSLFLTSDSSVQYSGTHLEDGQTYFVRVRIAHNDVWSDWKESAFRMNSAPTVPTPVFPLAVSITSFTPMLEVLSATDAEMDEVHYQFEVYSDSLLTMLYASSNAFAASASDTTSWTVSSPLGENGHYWWRVRATDSYEPSAWTVVEPFWVNSTPEVPLAPMTIYPPGISGLPVFDLKPTFQWQAIVDPDPYDTIHYTFELSTDSAFSTVILVDSLPEPHYQLADSLGFQTEYWWRVSAFDQEGQRSTSVSGTSFWTWTLGDVNHSHTVTITDIADITSYLFLGAPPFVPARIADINGNCSVNLIDLTRLVAFLFRSGEAPKVGCD